MEIEVTQEKLSKALNNVSRIAVGRVTLPILNNVLIRVLDNKVSLVTTNLDMAIVDYLPVSDAKDGVITVPAKLLAEFVSNLPRGEKIKISEKNSKITIAAGKYKSTINGSPADDFPELPEI
jgi:DNA polymerase-3 subunit beta